MKNKTSVKQLREFGLVIGIGLPIIFGWLIPLISGHEFKKWTVLIGLTSLVLSIIGPKLLLYPYKAWMALGHILGWINSKIILGLVFIIVLQPIALIMKLFNYDPLKSKWDSQNSSYREIKINKENDLTRIF